MLQVIEGTAGSDSAQHHYEEVAISPRLFHTKLLGEKYNFNAGGCGRNIEG